MKIRFDNTPTRADESRGIPVDYVAGQRRIPAWRWNLIVVLLASPVIYFLLQALLDRVWISAPGAVELKRVNLHVGHGGQIAFLAAADERVAAGATLAVICQAPLAASAPGRVLGADRGEALASVARLLAYRRKRVASYRQLLDQGAATQAELAGALGQYWEAEAAYHRLRAEIKAEGKRPGVPPPLEERVIAPFPGVVTQVRGNVGNWVGADADLITLADDREAKIVAYLDTRRSRYARLGRGARVEFRDGTALAARVVGIRLETAPIPAEHLGALESSQNTLQLLLAPAAPLPEPYRKHRLPVTVHFDFVGS